MKSIFKKEMNAYFKSMIGYIFIAVFLCVSAFSFTTGNLLTQSGDIKVFFTTFSTVIMLIVPILTMRIFSEEKKMRTDQLLFSSPITTKDIVLGKFLATMVFFLMGLATTLIFPIVLGIFGTLEVMVAVGNYIGVTLMAAAFISIGLFVSVLTENQISSAVITYVIVIAFWLIDSVAILATSGFLQQLLSFISISRRFTFFTYGVVNLADIIYLSTISGLFLFLAIFVLDMQKLK